MDFIAPGFFTSPLVHVALGIGTVVAVACAVVGVFTVLRGQSFAGHALSDVGSAGGSAAFLIGVGQVWGFVALTTTAAAVMELIGVQRARGRDVATGVVLGAGLGLSALLLYWDTTVKNTTGAAISVMFGSLFGISPTTLPAATALAAASLVITLVLHRPLMLAAIDTDLAAARRVPVRLIGVGYLLALALAVAMSSLAIGAILSTALLIGPAATGLRVATRPGTAILVAVLVGVTSTWVGILLAYDSFTWPPAGHGWPVSFFIVVLIFVSYLLASLRTPSRRDATTSTPAGHAPAREGRATCSPTT